MCVCVCGCVCVCVCVCAYVCSAKAVVRELWAEAVTAAESAATQMFALGAQQLLLAAPLRLVMSIDERGGGKSGLNGTSKRVSTNASMSASDGGGGGASDVSARDVVVAGMDPGYANGHKIVALKVLWGTSNFHRC